MIVENKTHRVVPLPAYDMHGELIEPKSYVTRLVGALVQVHFTMSHIPIATTRTDRFMADIVSVRVLAPPPPKPVTPRKVVAAGKRRYQDPFTPDITPRKKGKVDEPDSPSTSAQANKQKLQK